MRILVVSDLHYRLRHFDWLVEAAGDVDAVALVGRIDWNFLEDRVI